MIELIILGAVIGFFIAYFILKSRLDNEEQNRSRLANQLAGKKVEKLVPFMKSINHDPKDMNYLGMPVDYVCFDRDQEDNVIAVTFLEVKTGGSTLTEREKSLKNCIERKHVRWEEIRL